MDDKNLAIAKGVYDTVCIALDENEWKYEKDPEQLSVFSGVQWEDLLIPFILRVDGERQLVTLLSPLPFQMSESKRLEGAVAACAASFGLADGSFDYDLSEGSIAFRLTACFRETVVSEDLIHYMVACACVTVNKFNGRFLALNTGTIDLAQFLAET